MAHFLGGLKKRTAEVQSRCRTKLQALTESLETAAKGMPDVNALVDSTCALV